MATLTDAQIQLIAEQSKSNADLPKYYSAAQRTSVPISREFESYLILQTQTHKQETLSWIQSVSAIQTSNVDRDTLLSTYTTNRLNDAKATIAELDVEIQDFNNFQKDLFQGDNSNATVYELGLLAQSLMQPLDEMIYLQDRSFHEVNMVGFINLKQQTQANTTYTQQELQSWQTVISTYPGTSDGGA